MDMGLERFLCLFLAIFTGLMCTTHAYRFIVGGRDGWVLKPSESYDHWAQRMRFQVNDTLFFKYNKGSDSVLVVNKDDYATCNTDKPIMKMDGGDSVFKFDRSGPFFFISGDKDSCQKGQKLIVAVLAVRNYQKSPPAPVGQIPAASPPTGTAPFSAPSPKPISPSPMTHTPTMSPISPASSPVPVGQIPAASPHTGTSPFSAPSPKPISHTPTMSPATSPISPVSSPAPAMTPKSPSPATYILAPAPTPTNSPRVSPTVGTPSPAMLVPPADNSSSSGNSTAPSGSSAPAFTHSWVVIVLSVVLSSYVSAH